MTVYLRYRRRKGGIWEEDVGIVRISYGGIFVDYMDGQFQKNKSFGVIILTESCFAFLEWGVIFFYL